MPLGSLAVVAGSRAVAGAKDMNPLRVKMMTAEMSIG
jgi:hypothetical protein